MLMMRFLSYSTDVDCYVKIYFFLESLIKNRGEIRQKWQETAVKQMSCFVLSASTSGNSFTKLDNWITTL